jgi:hypothetical protein
MEKITRAKLLAMTIDTIIAQIDGAVFTNTLEEARARHIVKSMGYYPQVLLFDLPRYVALKRVCMDLSAIDDGTLKECSA